MGLVMMRIISTFPALWYGKPARKNSVFIFFLLVSSFTRITHNRASIRMLRNWRQSHEMSVYFMIIITFLEVYKCAMEEHSLWTSCLPLLHSSKSLLIWSKNGLCKIYEKKFILLLLVFMYKLKYFFVYYE